MRVDVLYAGLREKTKCVLNSTGAIFFEFRYAGSYFCVVYGVNRA